MEAKVLKALTAAKNLMMYQPVGCSQFRRDVREAIKLAQEALGLDSRTYAERLRDIRKKRLKENA